MQKRILMLAPISLMVPIVRFFASELSVLGIVGGGVSIVRSFFSQIHFFQEELYPPLYTFLWVKLVHLL